MIFSLDVRRARRGDCFLLHFGSPAKPGLVMIDGGPKAVYGPQLRPRLMQVRQSRQLDPHRPLLIDLLMVSHVDDDHIQGVLDLTRELREAPGVPFVQIRRLWHNSFDAIIGHDPQELTSSVQAQFGPAALTGDLPDDATIERGDDDGEDEEVVVSTLKVLASIEQGFHLRRDAEALSIRLNPQFDGKLVMAAAADVAVTNGLTLTVAGPMQPALIALQKKHDAWLAELRTKGLTPEQALAAYVDKSVPNLSSIVVLARLGGKSMLLTGDARGDKILEGLTLADLLAPGKQLHVGLLKVPHHGSSNNLEVDFFDRITADHYVFSGDGGNGNPERESMEMLFTAQGTRPMTIHLTYPIDEIDVLREKDWAKQRAKEVARNLKRQDEGKPPLSERPAWSAEAQSLAAFFQHQPLAPGQVLQVVPEAQPHVIDLLDPLGF
jgi:hypothetical protein